MKEKNTKQNGFSLLEMLLVVAVMGSSLLLVTKILEDSARQAFYKSNAEYMQMILDAAVDYVDDVGNFNVIRNQILAGGPVEIPLYPDPAAINAFNFSFAGGTPLPLPVMLEPHPTLFQSGITEVGPMKQTVTVIYRDATIGVRPAIEVVVSTIGPVPEKDLRLAASALGAGGAYISFRCLDGTPCGNQVQSMSGEAPFAAAVYGPSRLTAALGAVAPSAVNGGYLLARRTLNFDVIAGDYLYRTPQFANPELNRMEARLDMANNNIIGADNVVIDNGAGAGVLNVFSALHAQGSVNIPNTVTISNGDMTMAGDMNVDQAISITPPTGAVGEPAKVVFVGGTFTTAGDIAIGDSVNSGNQIDIDGPMRANNVQGGTIGANTIDATGGPGVFTETMNVTIGITVNGLARAGELVSSEPITVTGDLGTVVGEAGSVTTQDMSVNNGGGAIMNMNGEVNINLLTRCNTGC